MHEDADTPRVPRLGPIRCYKPGPRDLARATRPASVRWLLEPHARGRDAKACGQRRKAASPLLARPPRSSMKQIDDRHEHQFGWFRPVSGSGEDLLPSDRVLRGAPSGSAGRHPSGRTESGVPGARGKRNKAADAVLRQAAHQDVVKRRGGLTVARVEGAAPWRSVAADWRRRPRPPSCRHRLQARRRDRHLLGPRRASRRSARAERNASITSCRAVAQLCVSSAGETGAESGAQWPCRRAGWHLARPAFKTTGICLADR